MSSEDSRAKIIGYSVVGFLAGLFFFYKGFRTLQRKRLIENIPTSKIRSIAMGPVEVCGSVVPFKEKLLLSPFSNSGCVYYRYTIEEYRGGKNKRWVTVKKGNEVYPFYVRDDTGSVLVDARGAEVEIPADNEYNSSMGCDPPQNLKVFLRGEGMSFEGLFGINRRMRFREYFIRPGDRLYVMGCAGDNPWIEDGTSLENEKDVIISKGGAGFYYISDRPEKEVLKNMNATCTLCIYGGAALSIASLLSFLYFTGLL